MKRSKAKPGKLRPIPWTATLTKHEAVLSCTRPARLESGLWITVLSAVTRQCNLHRTVVLREQIGQAQGQKLLERWAKQLPLRRLK